MVYTRRRRVLRTKRRPMRKRMNISRPIRLRQGKVYSFKRTCKAVPFIFADGAWSASTGGNFITTDNALQTYRGIFKFKLSDLPNYTDFTNMYEQFKITGIKLRFIPSVGTESGSDATANLEPLAHCIDRGANDYILSAVTFDSLMENQDVRIKNTQRPFSIWIGSPSAHQAADAVTQTAYVRPWLDSEVSGSANVDYHGLKFAFQNQRVTAKSCGYYVFATYYVKCKNPQ